MNPLKKELISKKCVVSISYLMQYYDSCLFEPPSDHDKSKNIYSMI